MMSDKHCYKVLHIIHHVHLIYISYIHTEIYLTIFTKFHFPWFCNWMFIFTQGKTFGNDDLIFTSSFKEKLFIIYEKLFIIYEKLFIIHENVIIWWEYGVQFCRWLCDIITILLQTAPTTNEPHVQTKAHKLWHPSAHIMHCSVLHCTVHYCAVLYCTEHSPSPNYH